jgi:hypothetical protein
MVCNVYVVALFKFSATSADFGGEHIFAEGYLGPTDILRILINHQLHLESQRRILADTSVAAELQVRSLRNH